MARGGPCEGHERRSLRASAPIATRRHGAAAAEWCSYGRTEAADRTYEFTRSTDRQAMVMYACMHVFPHVCVCMCDSLSYIVVRVRVHVRICTADSVAQRWYNVGPRSGFSCVDGAVPWQKVRRGAPSRTARRATAVRGSPVRSSRNRYSEYDNESSPVWSRPH